MIVALPVPEFDDSVNQLVSLREAFQLVLLLTLIVVLPPLTTKMISLVSIVRYLCAAS